MQSGKQQAEPPVSGLLRGDGNQMDSAEQPNVASQRVVEYLAERILTGQLPPGTRIKQDELAAELNMSRIPVRDALRVLETRGLVTLKANSGARVSSLTARDIDISYRIREQLEPMLLANSMPNLTDADFAEMEDINQRMAEVTDADAFLPLNRQFHFTAFRGHRAPQLAQIVERIWDTTQSYRRTYAQLALQDAERSEVMQSERSLLLGSIRRRELELAPKILAMHIARAHMGLLKYGGFSDADYDE